MKIFNFTFFLLFYFILFNQAVSAPLKLTESLPLSDSDAIAFRDYALNQGKSVDDVLLEFERLKFFKDSEAPNSYYLMPNYTVSQKRESSGGFFILQNSLDVIDHLDELYGELGFSLILLSSKDNVSEYLLDRIERLNRRLSSMNIQDPQYVLLNSRVNLLQSYFENLTFILNNIEQGILNTLSSIADDTVKQLALTFSTTFTDQLKITLDAEEDVAKSKPVFFIQKIVPRLRARVANSVFGIAQILTFSGLSQTAMEIISLYKSRHPSIKILRFPKTTLHVSPTVVTTASGVAPMIVGINRNQNNKCGTTQSSSCNIVMEYSEIGARSNWVRLNSTIQPLIIPSLMYSDLLVDEPAYNGRLTCSIPTQAKLTNGSTLLTLHPARLTESEPLTFCENGNAFLLSKLIQEQLHSPLWQKLASTPDLTDDNDTFQPRNNAVYQSALGNAWPRFERKLTFNQKKRILKTVVNDTFSEALVFSSVINQAPKKVLNRYYFDSDTVICKKRGSSNELYFTSCERNDVDDDFPDFPDFPGDFLVCDTADPFIGCSALH